MIINDTDRSLTEFEIKVSGRLGCAEEIQIGSNELTSSPSQADGIRWEKDLCVA